MSSTNIVTNEVFQEEMKKLRTAIGGGGSSSGNNGGGSSGAFNINVVNEALDKTWEEIQAAFAEGRQCIVMREEDNLTGGMLVVGIYTQINNNSAYYSVACFGGDGAVIFMISDRSGYPALVNSNLPPASSDIPNAN